MIWQPNVLDRLAHRRLPGYPTLTAGQKERVRRLVRWRFEKAQETNRAPFMLLPDQHLVGLARLEHASLDAMAGAGLLTPEKVHRFGGELLDILREE